MNTGPTEPFTSTFGAVPRPEEPARWADPPPPMPQYAQPAHYQPQYSPHIGPTAVATNVTNIKFGAYGGYRHRCNHLLHGSLTLLTCGLWAPVWFLAWVTARQP